MGAFLWSQTDHEISDYWYCTQCSEWDIRQAADIEQARDHVRATGHTVKIRHESERTLSGMLT